MKKTLISIITPTYNREKEIIRAIKSVQNLKKSKKITYEQIIIDDKSKDNTIEKIKPHINKKTKLIKLKKNKGVNGARNEGIKRAKGEYCLFLDSDDELIPETLNIIEKTIEKNKDIYSFKTKTSHNKLMSKSKKYNKNISYKDYLSGKILKGEFINLVKTDLLKKNKFYENTLGFESIFWGELLKKGIKQIVINKAIRIYHEEAENRIEFEFQNPKNALKRAKDYEFYLNKVEKDLKKFGFKNKIASINLKIFYYYLISEKYNKSLKHLKKSLNYPNCINIIIYLMFKLNKKLTRKMLVKFATNKN